MCVVINDAPPPKAGLSMCMQSRPPLDDESIKDPIDTGPPPLVTFDNPLVAITITTATLNEAWCQFDVKQENCSALARHLFAHVKIILFNTKAEVAEWC